MTETTTHHRRIRSFVRREGRLTAGQQRALDELFPRFGVAQTGKPIDIISLFGRDAPTMYCNGSRSMVMTQEGLIVAPALDEGGNFVDVRYGPITLTHLPADGGGVVGDYHITPGSPAVNNGTTTSAPAADFDLQPRVAPIDIGADELP